METVYVLVFAFVLSNGTNEAFAPLPPLSMNKCMAESEKGYLYLKNNKHAQENAQGWTVYCVPVQVTRP